MDEAYPSLSVEKPYVIGVTPLDMYADAIPNWRFAFGMQFNYGSVRGSGVISTNRMQAEEWGFWRGRIPVAFRYGYDERLRDARMKKMVSKYVGLGHYGLAARAEPQSPLFNHIRSVFDLDAMSSDLRAAGLGMATASQ